MDAGQIMMMPAATSTPTAAVTVTDASGKQPVSVGLFREMLGQNLRGLIVSGEQGCQGQSQKCETALVPVDISVVPSTKTAEKDASLTDEDPTTVNQLTAYVQLAALQAISPVLQPQQTAAAATTEEAAALTSLEGVTTVQSGSQAAAGVADQLAAFAATTLANEASAQNIADSEKASAGPQKGIQQDVMGHTEAVVTAKVTAIAIPNPMSANSKSQAAAADAPVNSVQQGDLNLNAESVKQVQKSQVSGQQAAQQAAAAQPSVPDVLGAVKTTPTAVQQPVRFAQHPDVIAAATGSEAQKNTSYDQQSQGSQLMAKPSKELVMSGEQVTPELAENKVTTFNLPEQHAVPMHMGQPVVARTDSPATEIVKAAPQELISRQVVDRLVSHEIKQGNDQISLKLSPENLGNLQLNMRMDDNRLKLEIVAENRGVRDALLQQADDLKETLARQNIKVDSFNVTTGGNGSQSQQQSMDWRQMTQEQRQYQPQYASLRAKGGAPDGSEAPMRYFVPQYQSTLDVRF